MWKPRREPVGAAALLWRVPRFRRGLVLIERTTGRWWNGAGFVNLISEAAVYEMDVPGRHYCWRVAEYDVPAMPFDPDVPIDHPPTVIIVADFECLYLRWSTDDHSLPFRCPGTGMRRMR